MSYLIAFLFALSYLSTLPWAFAYAHRLAAPAPVSLKLVADTLNDPHDPCFEWVKETAGRVLQVGEASGALWFRGAPSPRAMMLTAFHVAPLQQATGGSITEFLSLPMQFVAHPLPETKTNGETVTASRFFSPAIDVKNASDNFHNISPAVDFVIGATAVEIDLNLTTRETPPPSPRTGEMAIIYGYAGSPPVLKYSVGQILSDADASQRIANSDDARVAYDAQGEFVVQSSAQPGFSGGAVFNEHGDLIGTVSRGGVASGGSFVRLTKLSHVFSVLKESLSRLNNEDQAKLAPYLPTSFFGPSCAGLL